MGRVIIIILACESYIGELDTILLNMLYCKTSSKSSRLKIYRPQHQYPSLQRYLYLVIRFKLLADLLVKNYIDLICSINFLVFRRYPSLVIIFKLLCCILYMCTMLFAAKLVCVQCMYSTSLEGQARQF